MVYEITYSLNVTKTLMIEADTEYEALKEGEVLLDQAFNVDDGCILEQSVLDIVEEGEYYGT